MVVEVFVAERQSVDALRQHFLDGMFYVVLVASIEEALGQSWQQVQPFIGLLEQEGSSVGTDRAAVESRCDLPLAGASKFEARLVTLCHSEDRLLVWR